jgi:hypothetical protein
VKHAGPSALAGVDGLLAELRAVDGLAERKPGIFYRRSRAFLHFHEDPTGLYADVRLDAAADFTRIRVSTEGEQSNLLDEVRRAVGAA